MTYPFGGVIKMETIKDEDGNDKVVWDALAPIVTTPHPVFKKPWVGLTDEERRQIALDDPIDWVAAIEAKLKEKNR
jgi:hypothetical protein